MSLGTLAINNNSDQVAGTGTSFTTELKVNDFIAVPSGGVTYTMVVKAIASDTALTITRPFSGPNVTVANWAAIPAGTMVGVTAKIADDTAYTMRMYVNEANNWMSLLTIDGDVTVYAPDGSPYTGPSWLKLSHVISGLALKGVNSDITELKGLTTALSIDQGGTGGKTPADAANNIGLGQNSSPFFSQVNISTAGYAILGVQNTSRAATDVGARVSLEASPAANSRGSIIQKNNQNTPDQQIQSDLPSTSGVLAIQGTSGRDYKKEIESADTNEAMLRIMGLRMVNFVYKDDELARIRFGIIAEEAEDVAPQYVKHNQFPVPGSQVYNEEGQLVNQQYADRPSIDNNPIVMDLLGGIQNLQAQITELKLTIAALQK